MTISVYTIGHSTQSVDRFVHLLKQHDVTAVADVRSRPYSRMNPQFNKDELKESLRDANIAYVFLGKELGARSEDRSCYRNGQVRYELLARTELFKAGIKRVKEGSRDFRVALMCAEKEPLDCHRTILISRELEREDVKVLHILHDGRIEEHKEAINRLVAMLRIPNADMFREESTVIEDAYQQRGETIAYRDDNQGDSKQDNSQNPRPLE
ncbi:MAG TPA: DUF488 domain-containing protein [Xanthobacteraceae bacterium]|jgi:uncharacterized protein (DUF488 family)|nr:DUF488 domain-containing protein [Xanthobacteraceae bacterium]